MTEHHNTYIERCFELALNGLGYVAPNPLVGCVIVKDDKIVAEGYHRKYGSTHAEVEAISQARQKGIDIENATLYVNLEPCSHHGKTPPCSDLLIEKRLKKVVISTGDPNPLVAGKGIQKLQYAGIEVIQNILQEKGRELNKRFFTYMTQKRPYIILKWAQTLDGFMDIERTTNTSESKQKYWISNPQLKVLVHKWRTQETAILVGSHTVQNDNPQLNARFWKGKNPLRLVLDRQGKLSSNLHVFDQSQPTIAYIDIINSFSKKENLTFQPVDFNNLLPEIMNHLFQQGIQSVIVEGGKQLLESFVVQNLWDEARVLIGNSYFSAGLAAPKIPFLPTKIHSIQTNKLIFYRNDNFGC